MMCKELGDPVVEEDIPPAFEDFPYYVHIAYDIFNRLPDRYLAGGMGGPPQYIGKDLSAIPVFLDEESFDESSDRKKTLQVISFINNRSIRDSIKKTKKKKS